MIEAVVFDVGGVLLRLGEQEYRQEVAQMLSIAEMSDYENDVPALQTGKLTEESVWGRLAGREVDMSAFDEVWCRHFPPNKGMLTIAGALRTIGVRTAVLSNTQPSHVRAMHSMQFLAGFDPIAFSCEIGYRKPEPGAFAWVIQALGIVPEKIAFIDDIAEYVAAASAAGINAVRHTGDLVATATALDKLCGGKLWPALHNDGVTLLQL